ncbi:PREDICTED: uncharacterized protein LOC104818337 isoform X3 [Tarenaya hassleriana]|uniref:uncharacterized protein LOC104818337 isoform X3 n=1 Tax=Tarenaya hassleriana TaxID=28532 RepID=UPI00053C42DE|nr:PREDICTED: uncharacterized protein LOC104818337 isoform X3 [Tarenaya hassleriana]
MSSTGTESLQYGKAKTSVWWDIENCQVPNGWDAHGIAQSISSALVKMNYSGPVSISAYGDTNRIPSSVQQALSSTGVALNHVPSGVKDASDKKILVDMLFWAVDNPAPANFMLISGDRDFSNALHQLRMRRYNILLAQPQKASAPLVAAATSVWLWTSLIAGGCPLTCNDSAQVVVDGCHPSELVTSNLSPSDPAFPSQAIGSHSEGGRIGDSGNCGDYIPKSANQPLQPDTKRNKLPRKGGTSDFVRACTLCKAVCYSLESFTVHLSGKRHAAAQAASVPHGGAHTGVGGFSSPRGSPGPSNSSANSSAGAQAGVLNKPLKEPSIVNPVWCNICQISCTSKIGYGNHIYGKKHQMNLEMKLGKAKKMSTGPTERPEKDMTEKKKVTEGGPDTGAVRVCGLCRVVCPCQAAFESHLKGRKHVAMEKKQAEELIGAKKYEEGSNQERHKPREAIKEIQFHSGEVKENMNCLERQNAELSERCSASEISAKEFCLSDEKQLASENELPPSAEHFHTEPSCEFPTVKGVSNDREYVDTTVEPRHASAALAECVDEEVERKKKKFIEGGAEADALRVCGLCKVVCDNQIVFDSHLKGQRHAANVEKQQGEELFGAKKFQEGSFGEKHEPRESIKEMQEIPSSVEERLARDNKLPPIAESFYDEPSCEFPAVNEVSNDKEYADATVEPRDEYLKLEVERKEQKSIEGGAEADAIRASDLYKGEDLQFEGRQHLGFTREQLLQLREVIQVSDEILRLKLEIDNELLGLEQSRGRVETKCQSLEEQKNINCSKKQSKEPIEDREESEDRPLPGAESIFADKKQKYPATREVSDCKDESFKKRDVNMVEKLEEELGSKNKQVPDSACRIC